MINLDYFEKEDNTMKEIQSYWIKKYESGIVHLLINTVHKGCYYHRYNDTWYVVSWNGEIEEELKITKEELGLEENIMYICTELQEKDQISFYYIPFNLIRNEKA